MVILSYKLILPVSQLQTQQVTVMANCNFFSTN